MSKQVAGSTFLKKTQIMSGKPWNWMIQVSNNYVIRCIPNYFLGVTASISWLLKVFIHIITVHLTCFWLSVVFMLFWCVFIMLTIMCFCYSPMCLTSIGCGFWNNFSCWSNILLWPDDEVRNQSFPQFCFCRQSRSLVKGYLVISPKGGHCGLLMSAHFRPDGHCYSSGFLCRLCSFERSICIGFK